MFLCLLNILWKQKKKIFSQGNNTTNRVNIVISPDFHNNKHKYVLAIIPPPSGYFQQNIQHLWRTFYNKRITIRGYYNRIIITVISEKFRGLLWAVQCRRQVSRSRQILHPPTSHTIYIPTTHRRGTPPQYRDNAVLKM